MFTKSRTVDRAQFSSLSHWSSTIATEVLFLPIGRRIFQVSFIKIAPSNLTNKNAGMAANGCFNISFSKMTFAGIKTETGSTRNGSVKNGAIARTVVFEDSRPRILIQSAKPLISPKYHAKG